MCITKRCDHESFGAEFNFLYEQQLFHCIYSMLIPGGLRRMTCWANVYVLEDLLIIYYYLIWMHLFSLKFSPAMVKCLNIYVALS